MEINEAVYWLVPGIVDGGGHVLTYVGSGERASFATALQLSIVMFMGQVNDFLPKKTDNFPLIVYYFFALLLLSLLLIVATVIQLQITDHFETYESEKKYREASDTTSFRDNKTAIIKAVFSNKILFISYITGWLAINSVFIGRLLTKS